MCSVRRDQGADVLRAQQHVWRKCAVSPVCCLFLHTWHGAPIKHKGPLCSNQTPDSSCEHSAGGMMNSKLSQSQCEASCLTDKAGTKLGHQQDKDPAERLKKKRPELLQSSESCA